MIITSKTNENIKMINKLKHKKEREEEGLYIIEGKKICEEVLENYNEIIDKVFVSENYATKNNIEDNFQIVSDDVFEYVSETTSPEGIIIIARKMENNTMNFDEDIIVYLNEINDPGNAGTIIRTLDALNISQVIISENTVDMFMPKVVRSSMGAILRVNIIKKDFHDIINSARENGYKIVYADMKGEDIFKVNKGKYFIIIGNESHGISEEIKNISDFGISIPQIGKIESLNVATSTSIIAYEMFRKNNYE